MAGICVRGGDELTASALSTSRAPGGFGPVGVEGDGAGASIESVFGNEAGRRVRPVRTLRVGTPYTVIVSVSRNQI